MAMLWLPDADAHRMQDAGPFTGGPAKGVLHTTEGNSWPDYNDGSIAPHFTVKADTARRIISVRQHVPLNLAAKSLRNRPGGVETNRDSAIQVELVGTCNPGQVGAYYWPRADQWALSQLAMFMRAVEEATGIKRRAVANWPSYPMSYGQRAAQRLSLAQWDGFDGWCGHMHVPENDHGDPGALAINYLVGETRPAEPVGVPLTNRPPEFPLGANGFFSRGGRNGLRSATDRGYIRKWQARMRQRGWTVQVDGIFGPGTEDVVRGFQADKRLAIDGYLGRRTWLAAWTEPIT